MSDDAKTSREFAPYPREPKDVHHPICNVWVSNSPCNCKDNEIRMRVPPERYVTELPCDEDTDEEEAAAS